MLYLVTNLLGRENYVVYYISPQSFIITCSIEIYRRGDFVYHNWGTIVKSLFIPSNQQKKIKIFFSSDKQSSIPVFFSFSKTFEYFFI